MKVVFTPFAWAEYTSWSTQDAGTLRRINELINNIRRTPFSGIGKPEPLKGDLSGFWSRRINPEHRLVYRVAGSGEKQQVEIIQCRHHY